MNILNNKNVTKTYPVTRIIIPFVFFIFSIIMEIINFALMGLQFAPTYFIFDISIIILMSCFLYACSNKKLQYVVFFTFVSIQTIMNIVNCTMYNIFGDILSFDLLKLGGEATAAVKAEFIDWVGSAINLSALILLIVLIIVINKKVKKNYELRTYSSYIFSLTFIFCMSSFGLSLFKIQKDNLSVAETGESQIISSDSYLFDNFQFKIDAYKKFGYFSFYTKSILDLIFPNYATDEEKDFIEKQYSKSWSGVNNLAPLYDDNLIVVLCESLDWYAIDPINTPTLWELFYGANAFSSNSFYARNRTNFSELISLIGNAPRNTNILDLVEAGYDFEFSLPNVFKNSSSIETSTFYLHGNNEDFYDRNKTHLQDGLGFDEMLTIEDYKGEQELIAFDQWISDYELLKSFSEKAFPTDKRFLTYFASVSTHGPYENKNQYFAEYYEKYYNNLQQYKTWLTQNTEFFYPEDKEVQTLFDHYKCAFMDFDKSMEFLLTYLKENGIYENTSILLFADHNSYYSNLCYEVKGVDKTDFSNIYINNIPFSIYSPKLTIKLEKENINLNNFCSTFDILPTICDLYGLNHNTFMEQGNSIFSENIANSVFSSNLNGVFNDKIFSLNLTDLYFEKEATEDEIEKFLENSVAFYEKQYYFEKSYKFLIQ